MNYQVLAIIERETGQAVNEATPLEELPVDSLEFADLLLTISNETGKAIPDEQISHATKVGDLMRAFA